MPIVENAGAEIYYEVHGETHGEVHGELRGEAAPGDRSAVVFAHGAGGNTMIWWQQVPVFAQRHRVITFDHRCFGRTKCASDDFHPRHFADDLAAILDDAGIERAALVCQSMGGWTGIRMGLERPDRVSCLALCGTPGGIFVPELLAEAAKIGSAAEQGIRGNAALAPDYPGREPAMAYLYDQVSARNTNFDPAVHFPRMLDEEGRIDPARLSDWSIPTLMVAGQKDQLFSPGLLRGVAAHIPGCQVVEFAGAGHSTYFEQPDEFNRVVGDFVAKHGG